MNIKPKPILNIIVFSMDITLIVLAVVIVVFVFLFYFNHVNERNN
jgi:hypothetical protein